MGQKGSSTNELLFDHCRIPQENLLGQVNEGYRIALMELAGGRIGVGSLALGIGLAALDYALEYAKDREQFGQPISRFQAIQWMLADAYTELEAAQLLVLRAAFLKEQGKPFTQEASMGKLYATEAANRACYKAVQILGGYGYTAEYPAGAAGPGCAGDHLVRRDVGNPAAGHLPGAAGDGLIKKRDGEKRD